MCVYGVYTDACRVFIVRTLFLICERVPVPFDSTHPCSDLDPLPDLCYTLLAYKYRVAPVCVCVCLFLLIGPFACGGIKKSMKTDELPRVHGPINGLVRVSHLRHQPALDFELPEELHCRAHDCDPAHVHHYF